MREQIAFTMPNAWKKKQYNKRFNKGKISGRYIQESRIFTPMDYQYIKEMDKLISNK